MGKHAIPHSVDKVIAFVRSRCVPHKAGWYCKAKRSRILVGTGLFALLFILLWAMGLFNNR